MWNLKVSLGNQNIVSWSLEYGIFNIQAWKNKKNKKKAFFSSLSFLDRFSAS